MLICRKSAGLTCAIEIQCSPFARDEAPEVSSQAVARRQLLFLHLLLLEQCLCFLSTAIMILCVRHFLIFIGIIVGGNQSLSQPILACEILCVALGLNANFIIIVNKV